MSWLRRDDYCMSRRQFEAFQASEEYFEHLAHLGEEREKREQEELKRKEPLQYEADFLQSLLKPNLKTIVGGFMEKYGETIPRDCYGWGSCQYSGAYEIFYTLRGFKLAGIDPLEQLIPDILDKVPEPLLTVKEAMKSVRQTWEEERKDDMDELEDIDPDDENVDELRKAAAEGRWALMNEDEDENLDNLFVCLQERSSSLWSASSYASDAVFGREFNKQLSEGSRDDKKWGGYDRGTVTTAVQCYLLYVIGYVSDIQRCFSDFDT